MVTDMPQGDIVEWRINTKHFQQGKTTEISSLDKRKPILLMPAVRFEPTTSQSLNGDVTPTNIRQYLTKVVLNFDVDIKSLAMTIYPCEKQLHYIYL